MGGGRYCGINIYMGGEKNYFLDMDPDGDGLATGRDLVYESLRQLCLWKLDNDEWWHYMKIFDSQCIEPVQYSDCGR